VAALRAQDAALADDLESLLAELRTLSQEGFLADDPPRPPAPAARAQQVIGAYTLESPIGRGGMGTVWLARRSDGRFEGTAAVKLLNAELVGRAGGQRFAREGSILARLTHPHIAHLVDAGVAPGGQPYLVLEHVTGVHLDRHCDERRLALEARLVLFLDVLAAVAHAHANLIVHRDLKPSNVLVSTEGRVKLLDFGIAKLIEGEVPAVPPTETREGGAAMTPAYAAPEQVTGGDITTATDVYSLGVLLHLLLAGRHPAEEALQTPADLVRALVETEPPRMSEAVGRASTQAPERIATDAARRNTSPDRLRRQLKGDLDTIVAKALKKDPRERYASVGALADDVRRFLDHQPIAARPDAPAYRLAKFVRRNRLTVALSAAALAALAAGVFGTVSQARRATRQAVLAGDQAARAEAVSSFLIDVFNEAQPASPGRKPPTVLEVVKDAVRAAREDRAMNALARTELLTQLGGVLATQGDGNGALALLQETFQDAELRLGREHQATLRAGRALSEAQIAAGDYAGARARLDDLLARTPESLPAVRAQLAALSALLHSIAFEGEPALAQAAEAVALCRPACAPDDLADALTALANAQHTFNAAEKSVVTWEEILALERRRYGPSHVRVASTLAGLSRALRKTGQLERAERCAREALAIDDAVLDRDDNRRATHLNALMTILRARRDYPGALATSRESLRVVRAVYGDQHPDVALNLTAIATMLGVLGDHPGAVEAAGEAVRLREAIYGAENLQTAQVRSLYGDALARTGERTRGEEQLRHAVASYERAASRDPEGEAASLERLGRWLVDAGDGAPGLAAFEKASRAAAVLGARARPFEVRAAAGRCRAFLLLGRVDDAERALDDASRLAADAPADPEQSLEIALARALLLVRQGRGPEARAQAREARAALAALPNPPARLRALADSADREVGAITPAR
jgi:serine/threonine-protein kinase